MLGSNVSTVGGIDRAFVQAAEWDCECIQIYTTPSRRWEVPQLDEGLRVRFASAWASAPTVAAVIAHVPFLVNAASEDTLAWKRSLRRLIQEVERAEALGVSAIVLHPGAAGASSRSSAILRVARALRAAVDATAGFQTRILLETMAGQGTMLGSSFEELAALLVSADRSDRVGVCFDTAHAFIAGYPFTDEEGYFEVLAEFDGQVGVEEIRAIHVNDARTSHGSHNDRHAAISEGNMDIAVFGALMTDRRFANVPKLLEIPERDTKSPESLALLRRLREAGRRLETGSPAAPGVSMRGTMQAGGRAVA